MVTLRVVTLIHAPPARCFDLARSVDAHVRSTAGTGERAVAGQTTGLLELGGEVTWEARHLGVRQRLTSRITAFDRLRSFQDRMVRGAFASLEHDHVFTPTDGGAATEMVDVLRFAAPLGPIGWVAERLLLAGHLRRLLAERGRVLKGLAESDGWREFCGE
jgi:ligand-binding SRPBCC domain-containing protein